MSLPSYAGFVLAGGAHYAGSASGLREEGIDPRVRLKALPMAVSPAGLLAYFLKRIKGPRVSEAL